MTMQPGGDFADIDTKTTSGARVYDYMPGGYFPLAQSPHGTNSTGSYVRYASARCLMVRISIACLVSSIL
jgi:hypothetical protein